MGLEMGGAEVVRPFVEVAAPEHPSLVDDAHRMDALFGVTNIPQNIWIDETGTIVRPPEPGSPAPVYIETDDPMYATAMHFMHDGRENPAWYSDRIRDWVEKGPASRFALGRDEVIAQSFPRSTNISLAAAHFELAQHLWREEGFSDRVLGHLARAHTLQPDNITYKRQAYSAWSRSRHHDPRAFFWQTPKPDEEDGWPFVSDFSKDMPHLVPPTS